MQPVSVVVLLRAVWMFNKFDIIWLLTKGGPLGATEHLPILAYRLAFNLFDVGGGSAVATLGFLLLTVWKAPPWIVVILLAVAGTLSSVIPA